MRASLKFIREKFREFNAEYFHGELPTIMLRINHSRRTLGIFRSIRGMADQREALLRCSISISSCYDLEQSVIEDTLIHEMIHFYIWWNKIDDTSSHGPAFLRIMESINEQGGRRLSVSRRLDSQERGSDQKQRNNYILVVRYTNGSLSITVCARTKIFEFHDILTQNARHDSDILSWEWYWSRDPWMNRYPQSRKLTTYKLSEEEYTTKILPLSIRCECDGQRFAPIKKSQGSAN